MTWFNVRIRDKKTRVLVLFNNFKNTEIVTSISNEKFDEKNQTRSKPILACRIMFTYSNAHAKVQKCIFNSQLPENLFEFGIIDNDFWSSTTWDIQIQDSFAWFKNPKLPGIQTNQKWNILYSSYRVLYVTWINYVSQ